MVPFLPSSAFSYCCHSFTEAIHPEKLWKYLGGGAPVKPRNLSEMVRNIENMEGSPMIESFDGVYLADRGQGFAENEDFWSEQWADDEWPESVSKALAMWQPTYGIRSCAALHGSIYCEKFEEFYA